MKWRWFNKMNRQNKGKESLDASINNRAVESSSDNVFFVKYSEAYGLKQSIDDIKKMVALDIIIYSNFKAKNNIFEEMDKLMKMSCKELDEKRMELVQKNIIHTKKPYELTDYKLYEKKMLISYRKNTNESSTEDCMIIQNTENKNIQDLVSEQLTETEDKIIQMKEKNSSKSVKQYQIKESLFKQILEQEKVLKKK